MEHVILVILDGGIANAGNDWLCELAEITQGSTLLPLSGILQ